MVVFEKKVYLGGGSAALDKDKHTVVVYDPQQDSYSTLPRYTCTHFSMAVVNNQLVLVGGRQSDTETTNKLGVWNEQSKGWTHPLPPMTTACESPSVATHNNRWLVVIGGIGDSHGMLSGVEILDTTESRQWFLAASLPQPYAQVSLATIGNMCYLLGGFTTKGLATASKKVFSVCLDDLISQAVSQPASGSAPPTSSPWLELPDTPLIHSTVLAFNGALLTVGGDTILFGSKAIYHYQASSRRWVKAGELPTERYQCICTVLPSGDLYVAGGGGIYGRQFSVDIASSISIH